MTVENGSAFRAEQMSPACGLAPLFESLLDEYVVGALTVLGDRKEVDREANPSDWLYAVLNLGRYRLCRAGTNDDVQRRLGPRGETQMPLVYHDPAPSPDSDSMRSSEAGRHRVFVPLRARSNEPQAFG